MSYVQTVLKAVTLPAMPDMKLAISAVSPSPSMPGGKVVAQHQSGIASVVVGTKCRPRACLAGQLDDVRCRSRLRSVSGRCAIMPGMITRNGKSIFGNAAISGVRRAADIESAAIARCTTRKSVHQ